MKIKTKIDTLYIILFTSMLLGVFIIFLFASNIIKKGVEDYLRTTTQSRALQVKSLLNNYQQTVKMLSTGNPYRDGLDEKLDKTWRLKQLERRISSTEKSFSEIRRVRVLNKNGLVIMSSDKHEIGTDLSSNPLYKEGKSKIYISNIHKSKLTGKPVISVSSPVFVRNKFSGLLVVNFSTKELYKLLENRVGLGETGRIFLVDKNHFLISPLSKNIPLLKTKINTLEVRLCFAEHISKKLPENMLEKYAVYKSFTGKKVLGIHYFISMTQWALIAEIAEQEAFQPVYYLTGMIILIFALIFIILWIVMKRISNSIVLPVQKLLKGTEEVINGNFDYRVNLNSQDELGEFSRAFNLMTTRLKTYREESNEHSKELEKTVKERTAELNKQLEKSEKQRIANLVVLKDLNKTTQNLRKEIAEREKAEQNLRKLSTAVTQSPAVIAITNTQGALEYVNPKFEELTGYSSDEVIGKNPRILKSGELPLEMYKALWDTISSGKDWHGEFHNKKKNGELFWENASVSPIFDKQGKIINYIKVAEDITDRKKREQQQKIINNISSAVVSTIDIRDFVKTLKEQLSTIIDTTNFYVALYDEKTDTFSLVLHLDEKDEFNSIPGSKTLTGYVLRTKKPLLATKEVTKELEKSGEIELFGADAAVWLGIPLLIDDKAIGVLAVQSYNNENAYSKQDIEILEVISRQTSIAIARKKDEENLRKALEKAQESDRLKSAFLANMSHEIRTPMNGILGFTSLLEEEDLSTEVRKEYIEAIQKSGNRMMNTINAIMDISKIEAGMVEVSSHEVNINHNIEDVYKFFSIETKEKGIRFSYKTALSSEESVILSDGNKVYAILANLVKNAIKYTKHGMIDFGYVKKDKLLEFYVKDTGMGIPEDRHQAIFERFVQADIEDRLAMQGTGLGLSIVKAYVEMLGGKIWLEYSEPGRGSEFRFTLPYEPVYAGSNENKPQASKDKKSKKSISKGLKILVAEDDQASCQYLSVILKDIAETVLYAENGKETIEIFKANPDIDLILMDMMMPVMNGYQATKQIRKFDKEIVIIAQTAYAMSGDKEKVLAAGCNDYITKPLSPNDLKAVISKYFKTKK